MSHNQCGHTPLKSKALRDLPSSGTGLTSVTALLCNRWGRARGESSPGWQPGADPTTGAALPCEQPSPAGEKQEQAGAAELALDQRAGTCQLLPKPHAS